MKVNNINNMETPLRDMRGVESHGDAEARPLEFKQAMTSLSSDKFYARLEDMVRDIDAQGEKLAKRADIHEYERYRSLIRDFMNEIVSNGFEFSKESTYHSRGRQRVLATVKKIDEKLDDLAKDVLNEQSDSIEILNKIDDIRGLILDLML